MRGPHLDPPDDSLDAFGPESTDRPEKLSIVDLSRWSGDRDPLDAFAAEATTPRNDPNALNDPNVPNDPNAPNVIGLPRHLEPIEAPPAQRTEPAAHVELERTELPLPRAIRTIKTPRTTRTIGTPRTIRTSRPIRASRTIRVIQNASGLAALAVLAFATITGLNEIRHRIAQEPDLPAVARAASQDVPAPSAATRPDPSAPVAGMSLADAMTTRAIDAVAAPPLPAVAPTKQGQPPTVRPSRNVAPRAPARETARTPERQVAAAPPPRAPVEQNVTPRIADQTPPGAPRPAATTGVVAPSSTPPTPETTQPALTPSPAATPVVASANPPTTANASAAIDPPAVVRAPTAAPAAAGTPAAAPAASPSAVPSAVSQRAEVEFALGRYARAFSALDAGRAKAVWPSVNQRNLERAFDTLEQQEFDLGACEIAVLPPQATALCEGTARYTPKVGNRRMRTESRRWTFRLKQNGQSWAIESVESR